MADTRKAQHAETRWWFTVTKGCHIPGRIKPMFWHLCVFWTSDTKHIYGFLFRKPEKLCQRWKWKVFFVLQCQKENCLVAVEEHNYCSVERKKLGCPRLDSGLGLLFTTDFYFCWMWFQHIHGALYWHVKGVLWGQLLTKLNRWTQRVRGAVLFTKTA